MLREDLTSSWESPYPLRWIESGEHNELHPISELPHPIVTKATDCFGADPASDNYVGPIASATELNLLEIKQSQWRGGVWRDDETGVCWLVVAGLAKGDHKDHDDFYQRVQRQNDSGGLSAWLPTDQDRLMLKQETAARLRTEWELGIQRLVRDALRSVHEGGTERLTVDHPITGKGRFAEIELSVTAVREPGYEADEVVVGIFPAAGCEGSNLMWQLTVRVLISVDPPEQRWDRFKDFYSNIGEVGAWAARLAALDEYVRSGTLADSSPGSVSHFSHRKHLAGSTINGTSVRALCGTFFVPTRDPEAFPECPTCQERFAELPGKTDTNG